MSSSNSLIQWYLQNKRNLPWRRDPHPYIIWVSEIILQQTQMSRGVGYYENFIERFPDVHKLAAANEQEVLLLWQGLGYYSRARNMLLAARQIVRDFNGEFPETYDKLILLKGIGDYTACAILSIAFNKPFVVVDGNVIRVFTRLFTISKPAIDKEVLRQIKNEALKMMNGQQPSEFNQALMELGALICKPQHPRCDKCPVNTSCLAHKLHLQNAFPVKNHKTSQARRFFHYFILIDENANVYIEKRTGNNIWKNLWEFPVIENNSMKRPAISQISQKFGISKPAIRKIACKKHILTHQRIEACFYVLYSKDTFKVFHNGKFVCADNLNLYPVHNLMAWGLKQLKIYLKS